MSVSSSLTRRLLPEGIEPVRVVPGPSGLTIHARPKTASARCSLCGHQSPKVHSRYERTIADLPWRNLSVTLKVRARRFFCANPKCERAIFCERLPEVAPYARNTDRLEEALLSIAFELGGEAGARLARELGLLVSPDALLERLREAPRCGADGVRVLGIDDWAKKKGRSYGTILVDLEKHRVVDLLPDRTAETLKEWLKAHPGIEVVSRDRYQPYIDAIRRDAPEALQVADRWHLMKNLTDTVERVLERERISLDEVLKLTLPEEPPYIPPLMRTYVKFCVSHGSGDVERLWQELSPYYGSYRKAFEYAVRRLRAGLPTRRTREETLKAKAEAKRRAPRPLARLFGRDPEKLSAEDREYLGSFGGGIRSLRGLTSWPRGSLGWCESGTPRCSMGGWRKPLPADRPSCRALPKACAAIMEPFGRPFRSAGATGRSKALDMVQMIYGRRTDEPFVVFINGM